MQAITVKYLGPTNTKGARYKATCAAGSVIVEYDYAVSILENVKAAIDALVVKLDWTWFDQYHIGGLDNGHYVAVASCSHPFKLERPE